MNWPKRSASLINLVLLIGVGVFLCFYVVYTVPPLVKDFRGSMDSQQASVKSLLTSVGQLALQSDSPAQIAHHLSAITRHPQINGVVLTSADHKVVAGAWLGQALTDREALENMMHQEHKSWSFDGRVGAAGSIFVSFGNAVPGDMKEDIVDVGLFILGTVLAFLLLLSFYVRNRLERQVNALRYATHRLARGEYDVKVPVRGKGPITDLTRNFNKMAHDLSAFTTKLRQSEERFELAVGGSNEAIWDWDIQTNRLYLSPRLAALLGYEERDLPGLFNALQQLIHPDDRTCFAESIDQHIRRDKPFQIELRLKKKDGGWLWVLGRGKAVRNQNKVATRMAGSFADVSEKKAAALALRREKDRLHVTLQSIADAVITTDNSGRVTFMNPAAEKLTGWPAEIGVLKPIGSIVEFVSEFGAASIAELLKGGQSPQEGQGDIGQAEMVSRSGEKHIVEHSVAPLRDRGDRVIGGVITIHDVTERFKLMRQLSHQAIHDPLTQLVNRTGFELRLKKTLQAAADDPSLHHAICYMDLDQFKIVNDTCGHSAGDELLRQIGAHLKKHVRTGDTLARLGGDEFGLILERCPLDKALEITEKIRCSIEAFRFSWEGKSFSIGVSIGLAPFDGSPGYTVADMLSAVDQACYIAKSKGRNRIHTYQPGDNESSQWHKEMQWVPHIHQAMDEQRFVLLAQPIVPVEKNEESGMHYEILLRMKSANGDLISPGSFLPAAERYDLMGMLDRWVVGQAIDMLAFAWSGNRELENATFGINISGAVLTDNSLLDLVKQALAHHKLPPGLLCFEITETVAIANFAHASKFVTELKKIGCQFALDDFGSGFASFSYLKTLPVDYLKIDGSFVRHLGENEIDHAMVDIINQLGHVMGLKTIAEFVENEEILKCLGELGVDYAQGYHIGRPVLLDEVCNLDRPMPSLKLNSL